MVFLIEKINTEYLWGYQPLKTNNYFYKKTSKKIQTSCKFFNIPKIVRISKNLEKKQRTKGTRKEAAKNAVFVAQYINSLH